MTPQLSRAITVGLEHGAALSLAMTALIVASLKQNPRIWQDDAPRDVRARLGPMDDATREQKKRWGYVMLAILVGVFAPLAARTSGGGFVATWLAAYVCFETFNLWDALVIDLGLVIVRPAWAFPEGAGDSPSYRDPRWHARNWLIGVFAGVPFAGLVGGLAWLVGTVL